MTTEPETLTIARTLDAPVGAIWRAWTEPDLLSEWFVPKPWRVRLDGFEPVPGGAFCCTMLGPEGQEMANPGVFLHVEPKRRLVFTSALGPGWHPLATDLPITVDVTMADASGRTDYRIRVLHRDAADRQRHEDMGFFEGWGMAVDQMEALASRLD